MKPTFIALFLPLGCGKEKGPEPQAKVPTNSQAEVEKTGSVLWEFETGGPVLSYPALCIFVDAHMNHACSQ